MISRHSLVHKRWQPERTAEQKIRQTTLLSLIDLPLKGEGNDRLRPREAEGDVRDDRLELILILVLLNRLLG